MRHLRRVEFQAAMLAENPKYDLTADSTRNLIGEMSIELMTAIVCFFDCALTYFGRNYFRKSLCCYRAEQIQVNLSITILQGQRSYEDRKKDLDIAVQEYCQAMIHLTARIVAGDPPTKSCLWKIQNMTTFKKYRASRMQNS